jgi:hypothetical protein
MPKKVAKPVDQICPLMKWDSEGGTTVTIRQATQGIVDRLENFRTSNNEYQWDDKAQGKTTMKTNRGSAEIRRLQVRETMVACNLVDEETDKPHFTTFIFKTDADVKAWDEAWDALPTELAQEIWEKVLDVNPQWKPQGEAA